jgi:RNA polymerase sigma-70 factor, ECF subfamily
LYSKDPLSNPRPLIRRVYSFVAYRIGDGPEAEDVTSATFERALRYRKSYDSARGEPITWLLGIARRCISEHLYESIASSGEVPDVPTTVNLAEAVADRVDLARALAQLGERDHELLALKYGGDLSARQIGELLGLRANAVDVALHRAIGRLRAVMESPNSSVAERVQAAVGRL